MKSKFATAFFVLVAMLALFAMPIAAQETDDSMRTITVTGTGTATGSPDIANIEIGVEVRDPNVSTAFSQANASMDAVIAAVTEAGVAPEDVRTINLSVYQERMPSTMEMAPNSSGPAQPAFDSTFVVSNMARITVRNIDNVGTVIDAAVNAGATNIFGLTFGIDNRDELDSLARADAMDDARARAEELAALAGAELGEVMMIQEGYGGGSPFDLVNISAAEMGRGGGASIEPGQLSVQTQLTVTFRITG
jgi:uncharacterized protein YggE